MIARLPVLIIGCLLLSVSASTGRGQPRPPGEPEVAKGNDYSPPVFLPPDRSSLRLLTTAKVLIDQQRYSQAVRLLQKVLGEQTDTKQSEDFFFAANGKPGTLLEGAQSLRQAARQMLGNLPEVARESYELQYGGRAKKVLEQAVQQGDIDAVADVQRHYFHTDAGYRAMLLLAYHHLQQGNPHRAALCFHEVRNSPAATKFEPELTLLYATALYRSGRGDEAALLLEDISASGSVEGWKIADSAVPLPGPDESWAVWLERWAGATPTPPLASDWVMFRGNATRTASSSPSRPLMLRPLWRQRVATDRQREELVATMASDHADRGIAAIPALQPLAIGDLILMRTPERVVAVDFESGKIVWQVETRPSEIGFSDNDFGSLNGQVQESLAKAVSRAQLAEQVWMDKTLGSMSSDGERVFLLEEFNRKEERNFLDARGRRRISTGPHYNVLRARSVSQAEGKLLWSVGGPHDPDPKMREAYFLGPPLVVDGKLYQIVELDGEVRLLVLDAASGRRLWQQQLAVIRQLSQYERPRRIGGISPSYHRGVLVCPTGAGGLVAIDLTSRNLRWGYAYGEPDIRNDSRRGLGWQQPSLAVSPQVEKVWADACAVLADDHVLVTPTESNQLHCLSLDDGKLLWKKDRKDNAFLACVYDGKVILAGPEEITALAIESGAEVGRCRLPESENPSGRGYDAEGRYYLPVRTAGGGAVLTIDLKKMEVVDRTEVRGGQVPGNLVCHRDCVISQSSDALQCFFQYRAIEQQITKALRENEVDPEALLRQGEILFDRGKAADAVTLFRRAVAAFSARAAEFQSQSDYERASEAEATSLYAKGLLREGLLGALKDDFVSNASTIPEIESILDSPQDRIEFLRVLAAGQERAGKWDEALEAYLKLVKIVGRDDPLLKLKMGRSARLSHIVRSRLEKLRRQLSASGRARMATWVEQEAVAVGNLDQADANRQRRAFFFFFPYDSASLNLKRQWITGIPANVQSLRVMQELVKMRQSGNEEHARWATAEQALRYDRLGLHAPAARCAEVLVQRWPDSVCWNGKTGRAFLEELSPESRPAAAAQTWHAGKAIVKRGDTTAAIKKRSSYEMPLPVRLLTADASAEADSQLWIEQRPQMRISRTDATGDVLWSVPLTSGKSRRVNLSTTSALNCGRIRGDVLVLAVGGEVIGIDTLRAGKNEGAAAVLWRTSVLPTDPQLRSRLLHSIRRGGPRPRWSDASPNQYQPMRQASRLGPMTEGGITFLRNRELVSVDPLTGEEHWTQKGLHPLSEVFGDQERVFVLSPEKNQVEIFSVFDGVKLGSREVMPAEERWTTVGARILCWRKRKTAPVDGKPYELALYDPWSDQDVWAYPVSAEAKATRVAGGEVAVFEKSTGRLVFLDLEDGRVTVDQTIDADPKVNGIYVFPSEDSYLLVTNRGAAYNLKTTRFQPVPQGTGSIFFSGQIVAIDKRTGKFKWKRPIEVEKWGLSLAQPPGLPILVLARRVTKRPAGGRTTSHVEMALIDKRTGREVVPRQQLSNREYFFRVEGDPKKHEVQLLFRNRPSNFIVQLTDDALDPDQSVEPADLRYQPEPSSGLKDAARAILGSVGNAVKLANEAALQAAEEKKRADDQREAEAAPQQEGAGTP